MRKHDFGTAQVFLDDGKIDVFYARGHEELKNLLKTRWKPRWDGGRFCYQITTRFVKDSPEEIVAAIENELYENAPKPWRDMVAKHGGIVCASKRYEIKIGAGGLRVMLPGGHVLHYDIGKWTGEKQPRNDTWELPAKSIKGSQMRTILERAIAEDKDVFISEVEPYEGRTITGTAMMTAAHADRMELLPGKVIFANYSFLRIADPQVVNPDVVRRQVRAWPFIVRSRVDRPEEAYTDLEKGLGLTVQLGYMDAIDGYEEVKALMAIPEDDRPPALDEPHAADKWRFRNG